MSAPLLGVPGKLKKLLDRLTTARAANLDNLDAAISTRAPASTALSSATWTTARAALLDSISTLTGRLTAARAANLDNLDAAVSSLSSAAISKHAEVTVSGTGADAYLVSLGQAFDIGKTQVQMSRAGYTGNTNPAFGTARPSNLFWSNTSQIIVYFDAEVPNGWTFKVSAQEFIQ